MPYEHYAGDDGQPVIDRWIFAGALGLAGLAGFVNVTMLTFFAVPVSHMSGAVARLGMDLGDGRLADVATIVSLIGCFLLGAMVSGVVIGRSTLEHSWHYAAILGIETALLALAAVVIDHDARSALLLATAACGMQNAMASSYHGLIIRTTHVTGIITDLGFMLGAFVRTRQLKTWKLLLLLAIVGGYFLGGLGSAVVQHRIHERSLYCAAGLSGIILTAYCVLNLGRARPG